MLFLARGAMYSVTVRYCVKTAKHIVEILLPSYSLIVLDFITKPLCIILTGCPHGGLILFLNGSGKMQV